MSDKDLKYRNKILQDKYLNNGTFAQNWKKKFKASKQINYVVSYLKFVKLCLFFSIWFIIVFFWGFNMPDVNSWKFLLYNTFLPSIGFLLLDALKFLRVWLNSTRNIQFLLKILLFVFVLALFVFFRSVIFSILSC